MKANGKLRPITDCSRPDDSAINNYMQATFVPFSYNNVEDAVALLEPGDFMSVVDISSANRAINVYPDQVDFQGITWDFGDGDEHLVDRRLCFGLRCAPNIFDSISSFFVLFFQSMWLEYIVFLASLWDVHLKKSYYTNTTNSCIDSPIIATLWRTTKSQRSKHRQGTTETEGRPAATLRQSAGRPGSTGPCPPRPPDNTKQPGMNNNMKVTLRLKMQITNRN